MFSAPSTGALSAALIFWHNTVALLASVSDAGWDIAVSSCQIPLGQITLLFFFFPFLTPNLT